MDFKSFEVDLSKDLKLEAGQGQAIIATLNVEDHDGDVLLPGVIGKEQHASILPAHDSRSASMGKAIVREVGNHLIADFKFNLDPAHKTSLEWHSSLKFDRDNGIPVQEWSFGLVNMNTEQGPFGEANRRVNFIKSFDIPEISPVLRGASIGTQTLAIKSENMSFVQQMELASASLVDVKAFIDRNRSLADLKAKAGNSLSDDKIETLGLFKTSLVEALSNCEELIENINDEEKSDDAVMAAFVQYQHTLFKAKHL